MQISFDTSDLSDLDRKVLAVLAQVSEEAPPKKTAEAAKKVTKKTAAKKPDPEPEPEPEPEPDAAPTMADAVSVATRLVAAGEAAKVKAALSTVGAKRVSEMDADSVPQFLAELGEA